MAMLSACSMLEPDKVDYKSAGSAPSLEIPPDLTKLSNESRYNVPGGTVSASGYRSAQASPTASVALAAIGDVRIERLGNQRWLVVNRTPDQLWGPVRDFWQESGFLLTLDQPNIGIMETDWAENRAKIPQDIIRSTLGKVMDGAFSTAERDRFRTRMERQPTGATEIFISHRGMIEVYDSATQERTVWQPRPVDPELEAEFLRRLMIKLGISPEQSKALVAGAAPKPTSRPWPRSTICRWSRSTTALTAPGAASAWRSTAPVSPWKTGTVPRASTLSVMSNRAPKRNPASSASCSGRNPRNRRPSNTVLPCAGPVTRPPCRSSAPPAHRKAPTPPNASCRSSLTI